MDSDEGDFSDMDELDFDSSPEDTNVELENQYYNAKTLKDENPELALKEYQRVLDLEGGEKGDWGFKALKQMMKINFRLGRFDEMMRLYKELLTYIKKAVTRNYSEKSINSILDYVSTSRQSDLLLNFYHTTLNALKEAKNDRLWFKANLKLGKLYLDNAEWPLLQRIIKELRASCETEDGELDSKKGTNLLEIFALEIQMYTLQKNNKKLKDLYNQSLNIKSAIPHPLIMGIIRECGGKMHLREAEFEQAHTDFFEAFKNYDESGSPRRIQCLKYLVLASMLRRVGINPLDSQEAKPYRNDPEVTAMTSLVAAYHANDIHSFEQLLRQHRAAIMEDQFIREHIEELLRNVRTQVLCRLIQPYTRIRIPFISAQLNIDQAEVEALIVSCILDSLIVGKIDQQTQVLVIERAAVQQQYQTMDKLGCQVSGLHKAVVGRLPLKH